MRLARSEVPPVYVLTARVAGVPIVDVVRAVVEGGALWIQYREKELGDAERLREVESAVAALPALGRLFVNDRTDLALLASADGVHLGDEDLPPAAARKAAGEKLLIGYSTHSADEALEAAADPDIDYVALGPIFRSATKNVREPLGLEPLRRVRESTEKPLVAIGGIDAATIGEVLDSGADTAAVIAAVYAGGDIRENVRRLVDAAERPR
ncbi:MAG: thiamine phosphate synthase [Thermoanaerobaculia bacterium]